VVQPTQKHNGTSWGLVGHIEVASLGVGGSVKFA